MKSKFWHERWESGQLGFHQTEINAQLAKYWPRLEVPKGAAVFVPLCGKSLDMGWLRDQGHPVVGVELSPIALRDYFEAASIEYSKTTPEGSSLELFSADGYELYCGDFFSLTAQQLGEVRGVYDRASLIALPPEMRSRYAAQIIDILPPAAKILLSTIEYDQNKMSGPPHSVPPTEVESLFGEAFEIEPLIERDFAAPPPPFQARGLDLWREHLFLMTRSSGGSSNA